MSSKSDSLHNGRSTSQISIYDYPEHLNPFYEAENHKRIRFWKIGKNKNNNGISRRGSFSLNGLKEMWAFKSFRPKKQSSTTCINKTSESPPPLRRDLQNDTNYGTYDPRMRHTLQTDNFQRNVPYRASLQDVRSSTPTIECQNGFGNNGFGRNQQYRSTIQTPHRMKRYDNSISNTSTPQNLTPLHRRYVYGGSVTPQPTIRNNNKGYNYNFGDSTTSTTNLCRGSSQNSVATNPFEDDDDDIVIGQSINSASSTNSLNKRPVRQKRRAPQPPSPMSPISKAIEEESTSQKIQNNENNDILNLTAEIETFIKNSDNDIVTEINNNTKQLIITEEPNISNSDSRKINENSTLTTNTIITTQNQIEKNDNYPKATPRASKKTQKIIKTNIEVSPKIIITEIENNNKKDNHELYHKNLESKTCKTEENEKKKNENVELEINQYNNVDSINVKEKEKLNCDSNEYSQTNGFTNIEQEKATDEKDNNENFNYENNYKLENTDIKHLNIINPKKTEINETLEKSTNELKITESEEDISNLPTIENETEFGKYQIRYVPLKDSSPTIQRQKSTSPPPDNYDLPPVPMARRRSVREIIESINRSQSLLKPHPKDLSFSNNNEIKELNLDKTPSEKEYYENNEDIKINNKEIIKQPSPSLSIDQNDNIVFEKCITFKNNNSRESSPTTSNLDWNPLPKPKRTKKLSAELMITED